MSNQVVGTVYQQIIDKVIAASQNDFEEHGLDQGTLDEMKQGWQQRLSELKIASFPWDPAPEPTRQQPPTVPSNVKSEADIPPAVSAPQDHVNFPNVGNVQVKAERYDQPLSSYPQVPINGYSSGFDGNVAHQRASALVAQRIGQAPHNMQMPHQQQQHHGQVPMHAQQRMMAGQGNPQQRPQQAQQPQPLQQRPPPNHVYPSQTDGSDGTLEDWRALMQARAAAGDDGPEGRLAADRLMSTHIAAMMADTDSGLGMTVSEMPKGRKLKAITRVRQAQRAEASSSSSDAPRVAPFDGDDDEESKENPDDAINSDLDDPEDDLDDANGSDDDTIDYMLCTYDKVQRVKNKWKCTLKDGILTTNKKEYLFHKANGEFEW